MEMLAIDFAGIFCSNGFAHMERNAPPDSLSEQAAGTTLFFRKKTGGRGLFCELWFSGNSIQLVSAPENDRMEEDHSSKHKYHKHHIYVYKDRYRGAAASCGQDPVGTEVRFRRFFQY